MSRALANALAFAVALAAVSLATDLAFSAPSHFGKFRAALHGATFFMTLAGAALGFATLRARRVETRFAALLGAASGVLASVAVMAAVRSGAFAALAVGLVALSGAIAHAGGKALSSPG